MKIRHIAESKSTARAWMRVAVARLCDKTLIRHRDAYGRDLGHTLDGSRKNIIEYDPATGRIKREQLGGAWFTWSYHPGTHLRSRLTYGASGHTDWTYEPNRDLPTQVRNYVYGNVISQYDYAYDAYGRRTATTRSGTMMSEAGTDYYGYNERSELTSATRNQESTEYRYAYDDIGNRLSSLDLGTNRTYTANVLNQYTQITSLAASASLREEFIQQFDADGNQTLIQTATGVWSVTYSGENRPVSWTCGATNLTMRFDSMGRRAEYLETTADEDLIITNKHQYFVYDGYLCLQIVNAQTGVAEYAFEWNPTEPRSGRKRPRNKNVSELVYYQRARGVAAHYEYAPFGAVTARTRGDGWGTLDFSSLNPFRFSSEFADDTLGLVYYNYRHYEPLTGRWLSRDPVVNEEGCDYAFIANDSVNDWDDLGLISFKNLLFDAGGYDKSWTIPPGSKGIPIGLGGGRLMILVTSSGSRYSCCNERGEKEVWVHANLGIEAYVMWDYGGRTEGWKGKGRDRNRRDPETGLKNKYVQPQKKPGKGFKDRDWHGDYNITDKKFPKNPWFGGYLTVFVRSSAGCYLGGQVNVQRTWGLGDNAEGSDLDISVSLARGVYGVSVEVGAGGGITGEFPVK
ncbi:MAG: RHS repeat domain-containing protein [Kiritimatiellia bacterium]